MPEPLKLTILLFASVAEISGQATLEIPFLVDETIAELRGRIADLLPQAESLIDNSRIARNEQFANEDEIIIKNDIIAIIPPVSGG